MNTRLLRTATKITLDTRSTQSRDVEHVLTLQNIQEAYSCGFEELKQFLLDQVFNDKSTVGIDDILIRLNRIDNALFSDVEKLRTLNK